MGGHPSDDRGLDTKLAILGALDELSKTRPFARLGVADVTKALAISRSSFYYHFSDRNDAVQWLSRHAFACGIDRIGRTLSWFDGHFATTRILSAYRNLIAAAAEDTSYGGAVLFYRRHRTATLSETLRQRGVDVTDDLLFQIQALAAAEQAMTVAFIRGDFGTLAARAFCERIVSIVPEGLRDALA